MLGTLLHDPRETLSIQPALGMLDARRVRTDAVPDSVNTPAANDRATMPLYARIEPAAQATTDGRWGTTGVY